MIYKEVLTKEVSISFVLSPHPYFLFTLINYIFIFYI